MALPRVLVADDEESILEMVRSALEGQFDVSTAKDGNEALAALERSDFACVVTDHTMPGASGVEVCRAASTLRPHAGRVLVTASDRVEDLAAAINVAQVHRFLSKPVRIPELQSTVNDAIRIATLDIENRRLVVELREKNLLLEQAYAAVKESERRLERDVERRTRELEGRNAELAQLALRDGLTGLYNHRFFQEALSTELARAARYGSATSLIFVDVDHFKNYNDRCGHPAGDELLRQLSALLNATGQLPDGYRGRGSDITARYGGEEFVIILPLTDKEGALVRARLVRELIASHVFPYQEVQPGGSVTVSIGVASYPRDASDKPSLIEAADRAMLEAKRAGRNRVVGAPERSDENHKPEAG